MTPFFILTNENAMSNESLQKSTININSKLPQLPLLFLPAHRGWDFASERTANVSIWFWLVRYAVANTLYKSGDHTISNNSYLNFLCLFPLDPDYIII